MVEFSDGIQGSLKVFIAPPMISIGNLGIICFLSNRKVSRHHQVHQQSAHIRIHLLANLFPGSRGEPCPVHLVKGSEQRSQDQAKEGAKKAVGDDL